MPIVDAILALITALINAHIATLNALPPEARGEYAKLILDDMKAWRDLVRPFLPKPPV